MSLNCGITGITNIGKTTIFNCCISGKKAEASNYAFSASKSNIGVIEVPDERLHKINEIVKCPKVTPVTVEMVDIPGLAKGSSHGEGIGNKFLVDLQQTDAIIHVLRCFNDEKLPHIEGSVDPVRDKEIIELELQVRDLDLIDRKIQRTKKVAQHGDKEAQKILGILNKFKEHLENFNNIRDLELSQQDKEVMQDIFLLTEKPVLYVCNVDDDSATEENKYVEQVKQDLKDEKSEILTIAGKLEAEIAELDNPDDRKAFLDDYGLSEPGVNKLIRSAYELLDLQSFFTYNPKELRAWTIKKGMNAQQAAGVIHSDMERGFIRAEVIKYDDFIKYGSEHALKEAGKFHIEGKNYIVQEGDIIHVRFNV